MHCIASSTTVTITFWFHSKYLNNIGLGCQISTLEKWIDSLDVEGHERVGLLSVQLAVVEQDLLAADDDILRRERAEPKA